MNEAFKEALGLLLKDLRVRRGLTLEQVRDLTAEIDWPISRSRLSALERGSLELKASDIYPLSRVYGCAVSDLISEAIVAHSKKRFAKKLTAEELFEEGKRLYADGQTLKSAWAFDEAARRAESSPPQREMGLIAAAHCYSRSEAYDLALSRLRNVLDEAEEGSDTQLRAAAKASLILARKGQFGLAKMYLRSIKDVESKRIAPDLKAALLGMRADVMHRIGDFDAAEKLARESSKLYLKLGSFDRAAKVAASRSLYSLKAGHGAKAALKIARDAKNLLPDESSVESTIYVLLRVGEVLIAADQIVAGRKHLSNSANLALKHGYTDEAGSALDHLLALAERDGNRSEVSRLRRRRQAISLLHDSPRSNPGDWSQP